VAPGGGFRNVGFFFEKSGMVTPSKLLNYILNKNNWEREWKLAEKGRFTYSIFQKVREEIAFLDIPDISRREKIYLRRASSGHFPTNAYLLGFRLAESSKCRYCAHNNETVEHLLTQCPKFEQIKRETLNKIGITTLLDFEVKDFFRVSYLVPIAGKILAQVMGTRNNNIT
jgi:hypothetical protein